MDRTGFIRLLASMILTRRKHAKRPLKVAIDGRCAAGKTCLADEIAVEIRRSGCEVLRPSVDGFHHPREYRYRQGEFSARGYFEDAFDYTALVSSLLLPLSGDAFPVLCRAVGHDVRTDLPSDVPPVSIRADSILLFDGLFLFRKELDRYWDLRILVDVDAATSLQRALVRDGSGDEELTRRKYELRYEPAWLLYQRQELPAAKADWIVDNRDIQRPRILKSE